MAFTNTQVGFERGATKVVLTLSVPQVTNRYTFGTTERLDLHIALMTATEAAALKGLIGENARINAMGLTAESIVVEWYSATDGSGPVTVKINDDAATTITCAFLPDYEFTEVVRPYTENSPTSVKYWSATIPLIRL